jgi:hypothetical protein
MKTQRVIVATAALLLALAWTAVSARAGLPTEVDEGLKSSKFVYMSSTRKDGTLGKASEIWFLYHQGAVYVGTSPKSWRARRIKWGRPQAKIWVGTPTGPAFMATGQVVKEPETEKVLLETFARKYPDGWGKYEANFRKGFADGSRILIKYTPN